jgi:hypothetical protein
VRGDRGHDHRRNAEGTETVRIGFDARYPPFEATAAQGQFVGCDTDLTGQAPKLLRSIRDSGRTRMGLPRAS